MLHNSRLNNHSKSTGFTLTEALVTTAIIATGAVLTLPSFVQGKHQGDVDRYTQTVVKEETNKQTK